LASATHKKKVLNKVNVVEKPGPSAELLEPPVSEVFLPVFCLKFYRHFPPTVITTPAKKAKNPGFEGDVGWGK
jgi:hypothetical protein